MRRALDAYYRATGALAAVFVVLIFAVVFLQVALNIVDWAISLVAGAPIGLLIPSYADFAGYFLGAATFFALASTFNADGHIRVNLLLNTLAPGPRRIAEIFCLAVAACLSGYLAWFCAHHAYESWVFGDASYGLVSIQLWIPQSGLVIGAATLALAIADRLVQVLATPVHSGAEAVAADRAKA